MKNNKKNNKSDDSDDDQSEISNEVNTDNSPKYIPIAKLGDKPRVKKIVINISDTQYPIIQEVAEELGWIVQKNQGIGDWDVWWTDREIQPNTLFRMNLHQKINHFPGIYILARKNLFGLGLMSMKEHFPEQYNFFPETWTIPFQFHQFRQYYESVEKGKARTYIVKPQALSQGRGIFLTRNIQDILNGNKYVIQRYIKNPLLIDKLKFDFRIYVLLAGTDPLRLYIYQDGLTRFATEEYQEPTPENMARSYIHLTNYSLNKSNPHYIYNTSDKDLDKGHKRTLLSTYQRLSKNGIDMDKLKLQIEDVIIKSVISGLPSIKHQYQYCQPQEYEGGMCFHILGFDVMLTDDFKPIVIEVNHTPSFQTGTPLDYLVKKNLIKDTLKLMRLTQKNKKKNFQRAKEIAKARLQTGKRQIFKGKQRDQIIKKARSERDQSQKDLLGGYKRIFPPQSQEQQQKYNKLYETAYKIYKQDSETRKKLINQQKKNIKQQQKKKQKKQKLQAAQIQSQRLFNEQKQPLKKVQGYKTLHNINYQSLNMKDYSHKSIKEQIAQKQVIITENDQKESPLGSHYDEQSNLDEQKTKKFNIRTKINKKIINNLNSNQQLVKYTESIKKFNELMVKYIVHKDQIQEDLLNGMDNEQFKKLKNRLEQGNGIRDVKSNNSNINVLAIQMPPTFGSFGIRELKPAVANVPRHNSNLRDLKLEIRNGSFVKPKNYLLSQDKHSNKKKEKKSHEQEHVPRQLASQYIIGGLIIQNKSLKAYSKLIKNGNLRGIVPIRR